MAPKTTRSATVVYDGACPFCRRCVQWARRRDRRGLAFVSFQEADLPESVLARAQQTVLWMGPRTLDESAAVVRVLWSLHVGWKAAGAVLWLVPRPLRDLGYRWVARTWGPLPR